MSSSEFALDGAESAALRLKAKSAEFATAVDDLVAEHESSMAPLFKSSTVRQAMQEGGNVQSRALLGADFGPDAPLFPGGLVASEDGLFWVSP